MKVRTGFVSNSSSSSFLVVGKSFDLDGERWEEIQELSSDDANAEILEKLGLPESSDEQLIVQVSRDYPGQVLVGFGNDDLDEYGWNNMSLNEVTSLIDKATKYFATGKVGEVQLFHGIVDPGH